MHLSLLGRTVLFRANCSTANEKLLVLSLENKTIHTKQV